MKFLDRKRELSELERVLNNPQKASFVVIYGRRRLGKSTLIKKALKPSDVYYMAGDMVDRVQMDMLRQQLADYFPELSSVEFKSWENLFGLLNSLTKKKFTLCLDEFPYMVKHSPELPSIIQRMIDSKELRFNIIICGSSQRMMQNLVLSKSEPLYGRADALMNIRPIPLPYLQEALHLTPINTIEEYSIWGGVPRYWELREGYPNLMEAIKGMMLNTYSVLYEEPKHIFLDDMTSTVQTESLMAVIAGGSNRLSEIAARMGRDSTSLSGPLDRLIQMCYVRREIPYGESPKKSKKSLYKIDDPLMDFYYTFILPNISNIGRGRSEYVMEQIEKRLSLYVSMHWEHLCRESVSGNKVSGVRWKEASRWWGSVRSGNSNIPMELDVLAESEDGTKLLAGECKWTNPENAKTLIDKLIAKVSLLPFAKNKDIIPVLFLKHKPSDYSQIPKESILFPEDIIKLVYG